MKDLVLFKASVPDTWVSARASLIMQATKREPKQLEILDPTDPALLTKVCECGAPRREDKRACFRCALMEGERDDDRLRMLEKLIIEALRDALRPITLHEIRGYSTTLAGDVSVHAVIRTLVNIGIVGRKWRESIDPRHSIGGSWRYFLLNP